MYVEPSLHHKSSGKCRLKQQGDTITHLAEQPKSRALTTLDAGGHGAVGTRTAGGNAHSAGTLEDSLMMSYKP